MPANDDPVAPTSLGKIGQLICAEAIYSRCLRPLLGTVDLVVFSHGQLRAAPDRSTDGLVGTPKRPGPSSRRCG
jgi:hypothetical protein